MKKLLVAVLASSFSIMAFAAEGDQPKHMISVGTEGLGWSGLASKAKWDEDKSGIKDHDASESNLKLNYAYIFPNKVMVGAGISVENEKSEIKATNGDKFTEDETTTSLDLGVGYNFNDDLYNSWWVMAYISSGSIKSESKDPTETPAKTESDVSFSEFGVGVGKRFSMKSWGLGNFTYSPSIIFASTSYGDDADDSGLESSTSVALNILKFDILF